MKCKHKFIHKKIVDCSWLGSKTENLIIYCQNCGKTSKEIIATDPKHKHNYNIKGDYAGEIGLADFRWWHCVCGATIKREETMGEY